MLFKLPIRDSKSIIVLTYDFFIEGYATSNKWASTSITVSLKRTANASAVAILLCKFTKRNLSTIPPHTNWSKAWYHHISHEVVQHWLFTTNPVWYKHFASNWGCLIIYKLGCFEKIKKNISRYIIFDIEMAKVVKLFVVYISVTALKHLVCMHNMQSPISDQ